MAPKVNSTARMSPVAVASMSRIHEAIRATVFPTMDRCRYWRLRGGAMLARNPPPTFSPALSTGRLGGLDAWWFDICTMIFFWRRLRLEKSGTGPSRPDIDKMRATIPGRLPQRQPEQNLHHRTKPDSRIAEHRRSAIGSELRGGPCLCPSRSAGKRVASAPRCNSSNSSSNSGQGQVSASQTSLSCHLDQMETDQAHDDAGGERHAHQSPATRLSGCPALAMKSSCPGLAPGSA